jgi:hypothetical protein
MENPCGGYGMPAHRGAFCKCLCACKSLFDSQIKGVPRNSDAKDPPLGAFRDGQILEKGTPNKGLIEWHINFRIKSQDRTNTLRICMAIPMFTFELTSFVTHFVAKEGIPPPLQRMPGLPPLACATSLVSLSVSLERLALPRTLPALRRHIEPRIPRKPCE